MGELLQVRVRQTPKGELVRIDPDSSVSGVWLGDQEVDGLISIDLHMQLDEVVTATITTKVTIGHIKDDDDG